MKITRGFHESDRLTLTDQDLTNLKNGVTINQNAIVISLEEERARVPEGIRFVRHGFGEGFGLAFNEKKQLLILEPKTKIWSVIVDTEPDKPADTVTPLYLEPCKRSDLKAGDWAYRCDKKSPVFESRRNYTLVLSDTTMNSVYVESDETVHKHIINGCYKYLYKVVQ